MLDYNRPGRDRVLLNPLRQTMHENYGGSGQQ
jgi:hypothetical protein